MRAIRSREIDPEELLRQVLDTLPSGLFTVDPLGRITTWNRGMEEITGYTAAGILGRPCAILRGDSCFQGPLGESGCRCPLFDGLPVVGKRCTIVRQDGRSVNVSKNARLMRDAGGQVIGGIEALHDISPLLDLEHEVERLRAESTARVGFGGLVGSHASMQRLYDMIALAGRSRSSVLIQGETGTGKELVAHAIHDSSDRREGPFIRVSCAALTETLLESELFGHMRGAVSCDPASRAGRFEAANGGTVLLDEIGDISPAVQSKLLRVLQEHEFERAGDSRPIKVDIRVLAATNRDLLALSSAGHFRSDLYYRLAAVPVDVPPLRSRVSDIPLLTEHFLERLRSRGGKVGRGVSPAAMAVLVRHGWSGNVRELEHAIAYAVAVSEGATLAVEHLPPTVLGARLPGARTSGARPRRPDRARIASVLAAHGNNRTRAAEDLGVSRVTLWKWMRALELS